MLSAPSRRRFTVTEIEGMVRAGVLREGERSELIDGALLVSPQQDPPHADCVATLTMLLARRYPSHLVRVQSPFYIDEYNCPEPDLAVVRGAPGAFKQRHPGGADVALVIEVAHTTQSYDRAKAKDYARAGVGVYWIVDLAARRLEERRDPKPEGEYGLTRLLSPTDEVELPELGERISVSALLDE